jgi:hypothetical protein
VEACILSGKGRDGVVLRMYGIASSSVDTSKMAIRCWRAGVPLGGVCICVIDKMGNMDEKGRGVTYWFG